MAVTWDAYTGTWVNKPDADPNVSAPKDPRAVGLGRGRVEGDAWVGEDEWAGHRINFNGGENDPGKAFYNAVDGGESANRNNYFYGGLGNRHRADEDVATYRSWGGANKLDYDNKAANAARWNQADALTYMGQAARGDAPSSAEIMQRQASDSAIEAQMGAANARGGAGAMYAAQTGASGAQSQAAMQSATARAQEMSDARQQYFMGSSKFRDSDTANEYQRSSLGIQNAQANNQRLLGMLAAEQNVRRMQLEGSMGYDAANTSARYGTLARLDAANAASRANSAMWTDRGLQAGGNLVSGAADFFRRKNEEGEKGRK